MTLSIFKYLISLGFFFILCLSSMLFVEKIDDKKIVYMENQEQFIALLEVYSAYDNKGPLQLLRQGKPNDGGYVVPVKAEEVADILIGYGIANDASFEETFSAIYNKPSYGFDCGISNIKIKNHLFTFMSECIANDGSLYFNQVSSKKISSYSQQLKKLYLKDKQVFIKMDIEGAEYEAFDDILKHYVDITGIVIEIHIYNNRSMDNAIKLLSELNEKFLLLHVHGNNFSKVYFSSKNALGYIPQVLELTYINKSLVTNYRLSTNQAHPLPIDMPNNYKKKDVEFTISRAH